MVTITGYRKHTNADGKEFFSLSLMGGVELLQSTKTGQFYATAWKTSITSTFSEEVCKTLVGKTLPGAIEKVETEPYDYTIESTGEILSLTHKYRFNAHPNSPMMEEAVFQPEIIEEQA